MLLAGWILCYVCNFSSMDNVCLSTLTIGKNLVVFGIRLLYVADAVLLKSLAKEAASEGLSM